MSDANLVPPSGSEIAAQLTALMRGLRVSTRMGPYSETPDALSPIISTIETVEWWQPKDGPGRLNVILSHPGGASCGPLADILILPNDQEHLHRP